MFCETCGKELPGRVDVCPFCGADVSDEFEDEIMEGQAAPQMNTVPQPAPQMNVAPQPALMPTPVQPMQPQMATMNGQPMQQMQPNMPQMAPQPSLDQMKLKRIMLSEISQTKRLQKVILCMYIMYTCIHIYDY